MLDDSSTAQASSHIYLDDRTRRHWRLNSGGLVLVLPNYFVIPVLVSTKKPDFIAP